MRTRMQYPLPYVALSLPLSLSVPHSRLLCLFGRCPRSFSISVISFRSYCSLLCPARSYLCTPTLGYLAYRAYANARAYPRNGVGTELVITMRRSVQKRSREDERNLFAR